MDTSLTPSRGSLYIPLAQLAECCNAEAVAQKLCQAMVESLQASLAWVEWLEGAGTVRSLGWADQGGETWGDLEDLRDRFGMVLGQTRISPPFDLPVIFPQPDRGGSHPPWMEAAIQRGFLAGGLFALRDGTRHVGRLTVLSRRAAFFSDGLVEAVETLILVAAARLAQESLASEVEKHLSHLAALRRIDEAIAECLKLPDILKFIVEHVTGPLAADAAAILLFNPYEQCLEYLVGCGFHSRALSRSRLSLKRGLAGRAAREQCLLVVPDWPAVRQESTRGPWLATEGIQSYCAVPLLAQKQLKGVLEIFYRRPCQPDAVGLEVLQILAGRAALAIIQDAMLTDLQHANQELSHAYEATLEGWAKALELRDHETKGHSFRVTQIALILARALGLEGRDLVYLRWGALLHDIGKIGIPDQILQKPGPLDEDEWRVMKQHPVHAQELLAPISYLRPSLSIPCCHHERWDGAGYPRGLKEEAIPLAARIFAVVDAWDALCSQRPYRPPWPHEQIEEHLRDQAGKQFDPRVVKVFLEEVLPRLKASTAYIHDRQQGETPGKRRKLKRSRRLTPGGASGGWCRVARGLPPGPE